MDESLGILRRPLDLALVVFFVLSVLYALLDSLPEAIGYKAAADSPWPPLRSLYDWAVAQEPQHIAPPPSLIATTLFDAFIQTPILFFVIYGLVRARPWIRTLSLVYAGAAVTNMFMYFVTTFLGPVPPPHPWIYMPFNLPWMIAPAILGLRMLPKEPFARRCNPIQSNRQQFCEPEAVVSIHLSPTFGDYGSTAQSGCFAGHPPAASGPGR